jgi:hypothetical protein
MKGGTDFTELRDDRRNIYIETKRLMGGIMKYAVYMSSDAMIYLLSFIRIGSGIQKI